MISSSRLDNSFTPLSDNILEPTKEIQFGHKWWVLHNDTTLQFMPRQTILVHHYQKRIVQYNNFMRSYFGSSWEMCVVFKNPLRDPGRVLQRDLTKRNQIRHHQTAIYVVCLPQEQNVS
jgi:hypothetical protein